MAKSAAAKKDDNEKVTGPASLVPPLPADFEFKVSQDIAIPETAGKRATPVSTHPFAAFYDTMGHNGSFFVPLAYFLTREGRTVENTTPAKMKDIVQATFQGWRNKKEADGSDRKHWRLVIVHREIGQDAEFPNMTGVRAWKVDTKR